MTGRNLITGLQKGNRYIDSWIARPIEPGDPFEHFNATSLLFL